MIMRRKPGPPQGLRRDAGMFGRIGDNRCPMTASSSTDPALPPTRTVQPVLYSLSKGGWHEVIALPLAIAVLAHAFCAP